MARAKNGEECLKTIGRCLGDIYAGSLPVARAKNGEECLKTIGHC